MERDHSFLDVDSLQALFRRLRILNRCAKIRLDSAKKGDVSVCLNFLSKIEEWRLWILCIQVALTSFPESCLGNLLKLLNIYNFEHGTNVQKDVDGDYFSNEHKIILYVAYTIVCKK